SQYQIVIASDGLWDMLTNDVVAKIVRRRCNLYWHSACEQ
ncbi:MAG: hypothetical protein JKY29_09565, partial [Gammaproteobacteria bacterium]|nr:hypothetical protein [Gammaproteobacteria bacterium]